MTSELTSSKYFELIVNWFLNLLVRNVIEREIEREKVQMKPPQMPYELLGQIPVQFLLELEANWLDQNVNELEFELPRT